MRSEEVFPPVGQFVLVSGDVAGERSADDDGGTGPKAVLLVADARDGDGFGAHLAVDAHVHLRRLGLVRHTIKSRRPTPGRATATLSAHSQVCRLNRSANDTPNSTNPRQAWTASAGVRDNTAPSEGVALPTLQNATATVAGDAAQRTAVMARVFRDTPAAEVPVLIRRRPVAWCAPCMTTADDCTCAGAA